MSGLEVFKLKCSDASTRIYEEVKSINQEIDKLRPWVMLNAHHQTQFFRTLWFYTFFLYFSLSLSLSLSAHRVVSTLSCLFAAENHCWWCNMECNWKDFLCVSSSTHHWLHWQVSLPYHNFIESSLIST